MNRTASSIRSTVLTLATLSLSLTSSIASAQQFTDLGHALYAKGYTGTVWVNSFQSQSLYAAHGDFNPNSSVYESRYGMSVAPAGGTVVNNLNGGSDAQGTATNTNSIPSEGSILVELDKNGNMQDSALVNFFGCPAGQACPWTAHFITALSGTGWTVSISRHVQGSLCGGELNFDFNASCRSALVSYFNLPTGYQFTGTDVTDTNYAAMPGALTTALCAVIKPICNGQPPPPPPTPVSNFTWSPSAIFPGDTVTFTDASSGAPTSWAWSFQGGSPASATAMNPQVTFSSPGQKTVTLTASNATGAGTLASKTLTVVDPAPAIDTVTMSPTNPVVCQPVTFSATGVTGRAPLTYGWTVNTAPTATTSASPSFVWSTVGVPAGNYTATLQVQNGTPPAASKFINFSLGALVTIVGPIVPTNDSFPSGTVQFHVAAPGATEWNWDFGDGVGFTGWTTDPIAGPNPVHSYTTLGNKSVQVQVRNCQQAAVVSSTLTVNIVQLTPLLGQFTAQQIFCQPFQGCFADQGQAIPFVDTSVGPPDTWDYDWNGDGTYEDAGHAAAVNSHTYSTSGVFSPKLRVHRGAETNVAAMLPFPGITVGASTPPTISINGPSTGTINNAVALTATGFNCTAAPSGWTWSVGTGTIAGASNTSSVSVTWTSAGSKSITATNSACSGATGSKQVSITDPNGGGGGTLAAVFSVTPSNPIIGQTVNFNGSASTGSPTGYLWDFGDGQTATGATATHAFATARTYNVVLSVTKPGAGCLLQVCASDKTQAVVVTATQQLQVDYSTPACVNQFGFDSCAGNTGSAISFAAISPTATSFTWNFGDGSATATGPTASHTFTSAGSFTVTLTGSDGQTTQSKSRVFVIQGPAFNLDYLSTASCVSQLGFELCSSQTGQTISFTSVSPTGTSYSWNFGDGSPAASGPNAFHIYYQPGTYNVVLTGSDGTSTRTKSRLFQIDGLPIPVRKSLVLPWIAQTPAPALQTSDLFINNPGSADIQASITFRHRGLPEANPPIARRTIPAHATVLVTDVLGQLFTQPNTGFVVVDVEGAQQLPVVTEINTSISPTGARLSQAILGVPLDSMFQNIGQKAHLVGLSDGTDGNSTVGLTNAGDFRADVRLKFFGDDGSLLSTSDPIILPGGAQKQFTTQQLRQAFNVTTQNDYRVEVESLTDGRVLAYGSNRSASTADPSLIRGRSASSGKMYLLGLYDTTGNATSRWQADLILANPSEATQSTTVTFVPNGVGAPSPSKTVTVAAGETARLTNALSTLLGAANKSGMVVAEAAGSDGVFPLLVAQSYDNTKPALRYGATVEPFTEQEAAEGGKHMALVGLRQSSAYDSTFWVAGVGSTVAVYDLVIRDSQGIVLQTILNKRVGGGRVKQYAGNSVPSTTNGLFTVDVVVHGGKVIAAGKVTTLSSKDTTYVKGQAY